MIAFVALAVTLTLLVGAGVAFGWLAPPRRRGADADELNAAIYREQIAEIDAALGDGSLAPDAHRQARDAIRTRLAGELATGPGAPGAPAGTARWMPIASVLFVCAVAPILYAALGNPAALEPPSASRPREAAHALQGASMAAMVERLARRLERDPDDLDGWVMLARSHAAAGRFDAAAAAYGEATRIAPRDASLLADRADVAAMAQGRRFDGAPDRLVAQALAIDPRHRKALALAGSSAFARRDYAAAIDAWMRLRRQLPSGSETAASVEASIAQARAALGGAGTGAAPSKGTAVSGIVTLSPALASRVSVGDTLFIYARSPQGSRAPVAVVRRPVSSWPVSFRLDDSHAMSPSAALSRFDRVVLEARISRTGAPAASRGDLRAVPRTVAVGVEGVALAIDTAVD